MTARKSGLLPHRAAAIVAVLLALYCGYILFAMERPAIWSGGTVKLWSGATAESSQHITDWYTFSHIIHGLLFYALAHLFWERWKLFGGGPAKWALPIAVALEASWELLENSPMIIDRYRSVTVSLTYSGDTIVNSMADIGWMTLGFLAASRLPTRVSIGLAVVFEIFTLVMIRDNLTLNVLMLAWPIEAIKTWQAGA